MLTTIVAATRLVTATGANRDDTAPYTRYSARRGPERIHVGRSSDDSRKYRGVLRAAASVRMARDRKSTRLNSSHITTSYAVFCLKKKKKIHIESVRHNIHHAQQTRNEPVEKPLSGNSISCTLIKYEDLS